MPGQAYNSLQNPRMYERLRKQGYSKQAAARISNARTRGHTVRRKAANYDAGVGGQIAGNLYRGAGGKFTAGSGGKTPAQERQNARSSDRTTYGRDEDTRRQAEDAAIDAEPNRTKRARLRAATILARRKRLYARREARRQMDEQDQQSRNQEREARSQATAQRRAARVAEVLARREAQRQAQEARQNAPKQPKTPKPDTQAERAAERERTRQIKLRDATDEEAFRDIEDRQINDAPDAKTRATLRRQFVIDRRKRRLRRQAGERVQYVAPRKQPRERLPQEPIKRDPRRRGPIKTPVAKSFAVFKSTDGRDCWACITTSAYEDRDTEIITRKGLAHLVATAKATGNLGTLNYWHTNLVLGDCTFQALSDDGLFLIEAGTFRTKAAAELGRRMTAKGWRMSPGFLRPASEPYSAIVNGRRVGLYDHPTIFERSPCPPGRASNLYTPFIAKEARAVTEEQIRMLKSMAPELADALLAQVETQKAQADKANAVFKGDTVESLPLYELDGQAYTVKAGKLLPLNAMPEVKAEMPAAEMIEAGETELEDGEADAGLDVDEPLLSPGDIQAIAAAVLEAIGPMFDIQKQIGELKNAMGGTPATKEAAIAITPPVVEPVQVVETVKQATGTEALQAQINELMATVKALKGDQPEAAFSRPTQSDDTVVTADNPLLAGYKGLSVESSPEEKVKAFLSGFPGFNGNGIYGQ